MYQLTVRQKAILYYLLENNSAVSVKNIAKRYKVSERTIRYDLDYIEAWLIEHHGKLLKKQKSGIIAQMDSKQKREFLSSVSFKDVAARILPKEERCDLIFIRLLLSFSTITGEELAEELMVSRATIAMDLKSLEEKLLKMNLCLKSKKGIGYWISGSEPEIRYCMKQVLLRALNSQNIVNGYQLIQLQEQGSLKSSTIQMRFVSDYLDKISIRQVYDILSKLRKEQKFILSDIDSVTLFVHLVIVLLRLSKEHKVLGEQIDKKINQDSQIYRLAIRFGEEFRIFGVDFDEAEITSLAIHLIASNIIFQESEESEDTPGLEEIIDKMLLCISDNPRFDIGELYYERLRESLIAHMKLTLKKYNLEIRSPNPLLSQIQATYPELFAIASQMGDVFTEYMKIPLDQDEISFIAIHLAACIEDSNRMDYKTTVIVCNTGRGLSRVLYNRVKNNIPELTIRNTVSVYDVMNDKHILENVDLVISTVPLRDVNKPVFHVSPIISTTDIEQIRKYISGGYGNSQMVSPCDSQEFLLYLMEDLLKKYFTPIQQNTIMNEVRNIFSLFDESRPSVQNSGFEKQISFQTATIVATIGGMLREAELLLGKKLEVDTVTGIMIHIIMSVPRWQNKDYVKKGHYDSYINSNDELFQLVYHCMKEISRQHEIEIPKEETVAIMRYLI